MSLRLFTNIAKIYRTMVKVLNKRFSELGLNYFDFLVLRALEERGVSMSEIAKRYYVTQATVTSTVDKLERMGLVKRNREEFDRRIVTVNLTEEGRIILKDLSKIVYDFMDKAVEGVDYESVIPVLEKVLKNVESMEKRG